MTDEQERRELTPREPGEVERPDTAIVPAPEAEQRGVERFSASPRAHMVGLTEQRSAQIVRQSGNARNVVFLALLVISIFIPIYWFYESGIPAVGAEGRLESEAEVQYVTDVARGYELYLANCARCHGDDGEGGIGPPLNDQAKLDNALTADLQPGSGHLNPDYIDKVLTVGGRFICGDPNSQMSAWREPAGPLNYRQIEELIAWITASDEVVFAVEEAHHGEGEAEEVEAEGALVRGWRDPDWEPDPDATPVPACWRAPNGLVAATDDEGPAASMEPITPGTAEEPRVIELVATAQLSFTDPDGVQVSDIGVVAGETVTFEVVNEAGFSHNFYIGSEEVLMVPSATTEVGIPTWDEGPQSVTWTVPDDLEGLQFACTVPGHYAPMHGDIVIQG